MRSDTSTCETTESILETILADVNAIIPNLFSLAEGYRLLVGAAEEIHRAPDTPFEVFERAVIRYDRTGTLIDILLELLCCKITFSSEFLAVTCAPIDLIKNLANCEDFEARQTAQEIVLIEVMRRILEKIHTTGSCFGPPPEIKPPPPEIPLPPPAPPPPPDSVTGKELSTEAYTELETGVQADLATEENFTYFSNNRSNHQAQKSPLSRKHI